MSESLELAEPATPDLSTRPGGNDTTMELENMLNDIDDLLVDSDAE